MKKIKLTNVTLACHNGVTPSLGAKALKYSCKDIDFGRVILLSYIKPDNLDESIEFIQVKQYTHHTYNEFMLYEFNKFIQTEFCLCIHDDGFIINPHLWDNDFLNYDYIGAPWPSIYKHRVGNGGFCLRSKKLLDLCKHIQWNGKHEDGVICIDYHDFFVQNGCKFAPLEVAMRFSLESKIPECEYNLDKCFGFHGRGTIFDVHQGDGQQFIDRIKLLDTIQ